MPTYQYECPECGHELDLIQAYADSAITTCGACGEETLRRVFSLSPIIVKGYQTLGAIADENRKRLGTYSYEKKMHEFAENKKRCSEYTGRLPEGAKAVDRTLKDVKPFWRSGDLDTSLATLPPERQQKFIMTGKK